MPRRGMGQRGGGSKLWKVWAIGAGPMEEAKKLVRASCCVDICLLIAIGVKCGMEVLGFAVKFAAISEERSGNNGMLCKL